MISVKDAQALVERPTLGSAIDPVAPHSGSSPPVLTSKNLYLKFFFFLQWGRSWRHPLQLRQPPWRRAQAAVCTNSCSATTCGAYFL